MAELPVPKPAFFWTARRRRYWRTCRRKYFLYYYAALGGHDSGASRRTREFYAAKKVIPLAGFLRKLLIQAMREAFYAPVEEDADIAPVELFPLAAHRAEWEFSRMLTGDNAVVLLELLQNRRTPADIHREMMEKLDALCANATRNAWTSLTKIPPGDRRWVDSPLELAIAELPCFLVPVLAVRRAGEIWLIEGTGGTEAGDEIAVLGKFAAAKLWQTPPQRVKTFILADDACVFTEVGNRADFSEVVRGIRQDVEEMTQLIHADGSVEEADFPADTAQCASCAFQFFCCR